MAISYSDFQQLDLRIGTIESAERVPEADKLLKLTVNLGDETRQIMAGIAEHYEPDTLIGKQVPILANLETKTMRGYESQGMMLAADGDQDPVLLNPSTEVPPGSKIK